MLLVPCVLRARSRSYINSALWPAGESPQEAARIGYIRVCKDMCKDAGNDGMYILVASNTIAGRTKNKSYATSITWLLSSLQKLICSIFSRLTSVVVVKNDSLEGTPRLLVDVGVHGEDILSAWSSSCWSVKGILGDRIIPLSFSGPTQDVKESLATFNLL